MNLSERELLRRLGSGARIDEVCREAGIDRGEFDVWWRDALAQRTPSADPQTAANLASPVEIARDRWGIPHIFAGSDADLFYGFGYAMAQDRLFQLDYLRRRGLGQLAEILGEEGLELDKIARTVGLHRIAAAEWGRLPHSTRQTLDAFAAGINAFIEHCGRRLPIEFALLDYEPRGWTPVDSLAIESEFRWYLTGRFPVIAIPELARRTLGAGALYEEAIRGEADEEPILWPGEYAVDKSRTANEPVGHVVADPSGAEGSNNWVLAASRTASGAPLLANDPHIAFEAVSCWYEAHLCGGSYNVAGMAYAGLPAIMVGRNERVAWGITNNICSQRDLYREQSDPAHAESFRQGDDWVPAGKRTETIKVRGQQSVELTVRSTGNGPLVDDILPPPARSSGPVSLKWLGAYQGGWLTAMLQMDRAETVAEFREAVRPWHVPTFNLVIADIDGHIALQSTGRIPVRKTYERAYRDGWDLEQQWQGLLPFEGMPHLSDPDRQWIATANNRVAENDYPYLLSGCWASGWRARRIRQMLEAAERPSDETMREMHQDAKSLRAEALVPALLRTLRDRESKQARSENWQAAVAALQDWNFCVEPESIAATIFNVFFEEWCLQVARERFDELPAPFLAAGLAGCASRLLADDPAGWFSGGDRIEKIEGAFEAALERLATELGPAADQWHWGRWHRLSLRHVLSSRGDLSELLDHGGVAVRGDATTVCNTGYVSSGRANAGAGYRMIADLSASPPTLLAADCQSQSGNPGSPHYADQLEGWLQGEYHEIALDPAEARRGAESIQLLTPAASETA